MRREDAQLVVVLVAGFAVVSSVLLVPPVAVRVAELSLDWGGLDVASVLCERACPSLASLASSDVPLPDTPRAFPSSRWGQLLIPLFFVRSVCNFVPGLNVPCLGPRHRSGRGRRDTSRRCSGCRGAGRSVAGQLGAGAPQQQPLPTAAGTPWLRFGGRASARRSAGYSVVQSVVRRSVTQLPMELSTSPFQEKDLPWLSMRPNCCTSKDGIGGLSLVSPLSLCCLSCRSVWRGQGAVSTWAMMLSAPCLEVMLQFDAAGACSLFVPEA